MGADLGNLCHELQNEVSWLQRKWSTFRELFEEGPERIELLNAVASNFFYFLHKLLFEDAMLHLSRLTDPPKISGRATLSVLRLAELISDPTFRNEIHTAAEEVRKRCNFARDWRHKWLAHTDLTIFRNGHASSLPGVTSKHVVDALESLRSLLKSVEKHYGRPPVASLLADPWGAKSLVHYLEKATRAMENETWKEKLNE